MPTASPTAPPVPRPLEVLLRVVDDPFCDAAVGSVVGMTVTVSTTPVIVLRDMTGVATHVEEEADVVVRSLVLVTAAAFVVELWDVAVVCRRQSVRSSPTCLLDPKRAGVQG